jgi:FtsP/CotA-like multicopper oxidase with cupredoxin domain
VHGLLTRPAATDDTLILRPGEEATLRFAAGDPGSYFYWAILGKHNLDIDEEREVVSGAFIVDSAGPVTPDRILMINIWGRLLDSVTYQNALAINGRSWPYTERFTATTGDSVRWRVINASARPHPMHMHGFYYRIDGRGDGLIDTAYALPQRRLVVTEDLRPFQTMDMAWAPDRPGNWLFHCHIGFHVVPDTRLEPPAPDSHDRMAHDPAVHMAGLVVGITVKPRPGEAPAARINPRRLRLYVQEGVPHQRAPRRLGFVLQRGARPPAPDSVEVPGSVIVTTRGQPTDIMVLNRLHEPAAIHWHGVELESYSDGVAGWSGHDTILAPSIQPGDSFLAHLTLPRTGTFIYHTHMNDIEQLSSGLYGALIVLEPGRRFDPTRDHVYVIGWDGPSDPPYPLLNGESQPPPLTLKAGVPHRFRFVNIGAAQRYIVTILRDTAAVEWRRLAKDGADLPINQAVVTRAAQMVQIGETYDFEWTPVAGTYRLMVPAQDSARADISQQLIAK